MSKDNVTKFYPKDAAKNPDFVLEQAVGKFDKVVVMGVNKEGEFDSRCSLNCSLAEVNLYADRIKSHLGDSLEFTEDEED